MPRSLITGDDLFQTVRTYAALGNHRVGTDVDAKTIEWFASVLQQLGGKIERQPFSFDRFDGTSTVTIDDQPIESLPLYYEGVGDVTSDHPFVAAVAVMNEHSQASDALNDAIAQAKRSGAQVAVIASVNPLGTLPVPNRLPVLGSGLPVVLVPGRVADRLKTGTVKVDYHARLVPGRSENVVAAFGEIAAAPIVLATPLSGWFTCASERGTGIAITLALAQRLSQAYPVQVVGTSAHELPYLGLQAFVKANKLAPRLLVHLGANVALGQHDAASGTLQLAPRRTANVRMPAASVERIKPMLAAIGLTPTINPPLWFGESALWVESQPAPVVSLVGFGPQFHTPLDLPETTTNSELLLRVYEALGRAIDELLKPVP